ncbi:MAG TPA: ABC transporter substrate-binding protein [Mycobacterium sp.]|nr:ABC transporter substrate-binding protein [Mycobacterium sp.]
MKKRLAALAAMASGVLVLAGCSSGGESTEEGARQSLKMGMAATDTFTAEWWGWLAADKLGYYNDLNLDVEFVPTGGSGDAIEQLIAGNLDAGNPSMPSVGEALLGGQDVVNIFTYSTGAIFGVFAPNDSGIKAIADLRGKKIGVSEAGGGEVAFLESALRAEGIDPISDVTIIPIGDGGPETYAALNNKSVDAYSTAYNDIFGLQTSGMSLDDLTPESYKSFPARGIITTSKVIGEKPRALEALSRGTAMGIEFCLANNEACIDFLKEANPAAFEANADGVSQGLLRFDLSLTQVPPKNPERIGAHDEEQTRIFLDTIASTMESSSPYDLNTFLNTQFLDFANDFDRAQVREQAANFGG